MPIYGSAPYSITQKFQKMTDSKIALQPFSAVIRLHGKELKISNIFSEEGVFLPWRSSLLPFPMDRGFVVFHYWAPAYGDRNVRCPLLYGRASQLFGKGRSEEPGCFSYCPFKASKSLSCPINYLMATENVLLLPPRGYSTENPLKSIASQSIVHI